MQPSRDTSIRVIQPLPRITDDCIPPSESCNPESQSSSTETLAQLQQRLKFETLLRRITEQLHSSLDKTQILQRTVRELTMGLGIKGCNLALYDLEQGNLTLCYECLGSKLAAAVSSGAVPLVALNQTISLASQADLYQPLLQHQTIQFCSLEAKEPSSRWRRGRVTCLACPIQDAEVLLGDLWLFKSKSQEFSPAEIRLVQQVAHQCGIALQKADLHQQAQTRVGELERLHRLKDDFLSTVSHELRTPMANIKMAIQLLEMNLEESESANLTPAQRYLKILKDETDREIILINDLLDLSRLEAGTEPLMLATINPVFWLPAILEPFMERAKLQQQQFQVDLATYLPQLTTDLGDLERILGELLNNACKYTPIGERIIVAVRLLKTPTAQTPVFLLSVTNSGIEIPAVEQDRIFDKFYRIPNHAAWQPGGTGLGLALVKGLVERLSGKIRVESYAGLTRFTVELPSRPPSEQAG